MTLLMDYTDEGRTRIEETVTDGLEFEVRSVAYGSSGYNPGTPTTALPLDPVATALVSEQFRKPVSKITVETYTAFRGEETVYTTVGGDEFTSILGEAAIFAVVTNPGTTALAAGYEFMLAQAHFPRVVLSTYGRLAITWPLDLTYSP